MRIKALSSTVNAKGGNDDWNSAIQTFSSESALESYITDRSYDNHGYSNVGPRLQLTVVA
jgi:hypothetical protein